MKKTLLFTASIAIAAACSASAQVRITEWMYQSASDTFEFIELTNMGSAAVDFAGWGFNDEKGLGDGLFDISGFGVVAAGESVLLTDMAVADFRAAWDLDESIKILTGYANGFGRNDVINVFDQNGDLVDRLTYGDDGYAPGSPRTRGASGNILEENLGFNDASAAIMAQAGDIFGSYAIASGDIGNPGYYYAAVPEPQTVALALSAVVALTAFALRRRRA